MLRQCFGVAAMSMVAATYSIPATAQSAAPEENALHIDEIFITGSPLGRDRFDVVQGTSVLTGDRLAAALRPSIGETLSSQPGVTSTFFGPYASRPIIRGFDGDRIRVLFDGIGSIDASSVSPDHQTAGDSMGAERIEVLRGPATLLYGTSAIGGVVNIIDGRIPQEVPARGYHGHAIGGYGTNANERFVSGGADVKSANGLMIHADGSWRKTGDYSVPGYASEEAEEEGIRGRVENTDGRTASAVGGASYIWENGVIGAAVQRFTSNYGVAGHHHHEEGAGEEVPHEETLVRIDLKQTRVDLKGEVRDLGSFITTVRARAAFGDYQHQEIEGADVGTTFTTNYGVAGHHHHEEGAEEEVPHEETLVRIDLKQTRVDLKGEVRDLGSFITTVRARAAFGDYQHQEIEGADVGTTFTNEGWEGRLEAMHAPIGPLNGIFGIQYRTRDFAAIGDEAFTPPSDTSHVAGFLLESAVIGPWRLEAGGRVEGTRIALPDGSRRQFTSSAASGSVAYEFATDTLIGATVSWTERPPTAEELFSEGPHLATNQFERGDAALGEEEAVNLEVTLRRAVGPLTGSVSLYRTWYDRFIFAQETGAEEDELPVFQFTAVDARFQGLESEVTLQVIDEPTYGVAFDAGLDVVRATNVTAGEPLPRIPPFRYRFGVEARWQMLDGRIEVAGAAAQNRTSPLETSTDGYTFLNARLGYKPFEDQDVQFVLQAQNLTNAAGRPHTSFLKDIAPLPGRDVRLYLRVSY